jgi:hypothetical protein
MNWVAADRLRQWPAPPARADSHLLLFSWQRLYQSVFSR